MNKSKTIFGAGLFISSLTCLTLLFSQMPTFGAQFDKKNYSDSSQVASILPSDIFPKSTNSSSVNSSNNKSNSNSSNKASNGNLQQVPAPKGKAFNITDAKYGAVSGEIANKAIADAAKDAQSAGYGSYVFIPAGTFIVEGILPIPGVSIQGIGAASVISMDLSSSLMLTRGNNFSITNLAITGTLVLDHDNNVQVNNCLFTPTNGIKICLLTTNCDHIHVSNNSFMGTPFLFAIGFCYPTLNSDIQNNVFSSDPTPDYYIAALHSILLAGATNCNVNSNNFLAASKSDLHSNIDLSGMTYFPVDLTNVHFIEGPNSNVNITNNRFSSGRVQNVINAEPNTISSTGAYWTTYNDPGFLNNTVNITGNVMNVPLPNGPQLSPNFCSLQNVLNVNISNNTITGGGIATQSSRGVNIANNAVSEVRGLLISVIPSTIGSTTISGNILKDCLKKPATDLTYKNMAAAAIWIYPAGGASAISITDNTYSGLIPNYFIDCMQPNVKASNNQAPAYLPSYFAK